MLDADPIYVGATYTELDEGSDAHGDHFEVAFVGGADGTQLTSLLIDTDRSPAPLGGDGQPDEAAGQILQQGDLFFDTADTGFGALQSLGFQIVDNQGIDSIQVFVNDGGTKLELRFTGFDAGDKLVFTIDVDQVLFPALDDTLGGALLETTDPSSLTPEQLAFFNHESVDPVTSAAEFARSRLHVEFAAPGHFDIEGNTIFRNAYNLQLVGTPLDGLDVKGEQLLKLDGSNGDPDRDAGAVLPLQQQEKPITIAGTVFHDRDVDLIQDAGEEGINNVVLALYKKNDAGVFVDTTFRAQTNSNGDYLFGEDLGLGSGVYRVVETQPADYPYSVGAIPGTVETVGVGNVDPLDNNILDQIIIPLGGQHAVDYDFAEAKPAVLSGYVYHDRNDDGIRTPATEEGLANVEIRIVPISTRFGQTSITLYTNDQGYYESPPLAPGLYRVIEVVQPAGYLDGKDTRGQVDGVPTGLAQNEIITNIFLASTSVGTEYNFGEIKYAEIHGSVHLSDPDGDCYEENEGDLRGIEGVRILLINQTTGAETEAFTDANGEYWFTELTPGEYTIVEFTPPELLDGDDHVGLVDGLGSGGLVGNDRIENIVLGAGAVGVNYDFCEHEPAEISGYVYHDADNDGVFDSNEDPIAQVQVDLIDENGVVIATQNTLGDGSYKFDRLSLGVYRVVEHQPTGWDDGKDTLGTVAGSIVGVASNDQLDLIALKYGDKGVNYNFGERLLSEIHGSVHLSDPDGNCEEEFEGQLRGIEGVLLRLINNRTGEIRETRTDENGDYWFTGLDNDEYTLLEFTPDGLLDGDEHVGTVRDVAVGALDGNDKITSIHLGPGDVGVDYDFCEHEPAEISGFVYHDADNDGVFDNNEDPIPQVQVDLLNDQGEIIASQQTLADGSYKFDGLSLGVYSVVEHQPEGWDDGKDTLGTIGGVTVGSVLNDKLQTISLQYGDKGVNYNFGERLLSELHGSVHLSDPDGNCEEEFEGQLRGIEGVLLRLINNRTGEIRETRTDANGDYWFTELDNDEYTLIEFTPDGLLDGDEHVGTVRDVAVGTLDGSDKIVSIHLGPGDVGVDYDFCEHEPAEISGFVYHDADNDGVFDNNEDPIPQVQVDLLNDKGEVIASQQTLADGSYKFDRLALGVYTVVEHQPDNWDDGKDTLGTVGGVIVGDASNDRLGLIALKYGDKGVDYNFGERRLSEIHGSVHLSDPDGNCEEEFEGQLRGIEGVLLRLINNRTGEIHETRTDENGDYWFTGLDNDEYTLIEFTPDGLLDGDEHVGTVRDVAVGTLDGSDKITSIHLGPGDVGVDYDFCEHEPAMISGFVYHDKDNDGVYDANEDPIEGAVVMIFKGDTVVGTATTGADGSYKFTDLRAGEYRIMETQPAGFLDGKDTAGTIAGATVGVADSAADKINAISLKYGETGVNYNFGEVLPGSIAGVVHVDPNLDCILDEGEVRLEGVVIRLLDGNGNELARTTTDVDGQYYFGNLLPGAYTIVEEQPEGYFHGGQVVGDGDGDASFADVISKVNITSGLNLHNYNFCETPPSAISGYVFVDGATIVTPDGLPPATLAGIRDGQLTSDDRRLPGVVLELRDGITGEPIDASTALPGYYNDGPIRVVTDSSGYYLFQGLTFGNYAVFEVQPEALYDGIDTAGTTSGIAINPGDNVNPQFLFQLTVDPLNDAIIRIPLGIGQHSELNNFSEIQAEKIPTPPNETPPVFLPPVVIPVVGATPPPAPLFIPPPILVEPPIQFISVTQEYTWHLSIVNAGDPRGPGLPTAAQDSSLLSTVSLVQRDQWTNERMQNGVWSQGIFDENGSLIVRNGAYGVDGAIPIAGDFNGDGVDEIGIFYRGEWLIDLNGDGKWDEADLWAQLGSEEDFPVTGDWDGDGKDDIGIFGPIWARDPRAIESEPGLPDADNRREVVNTLTDRLIEKNVPPTEELATNGQRTIRRSADGPLRADLIDHVFKYGNESAVPVTGDWNGDGIRTIGIFHEGQWRLDSNGDGRIGEEDEKVSLGQAGDIPVVGDFNGDGVDELGVYRGGVWHLDVDGNRTLDAADRVFEMGGANDQPVVGDWNGDGVDDPGVYHVPSSAPVRKAS
ncbi:SdrD B-like domain-containing protein [Lignipirellula cremea]|nr:SdrD B-like domain-containing protein [Lignipirellula cremea]